MLTFKGLKGTNYYLAWIILTLLPLAHQRKSSNNKRQEIGAWPIGMYNTSLLGKTFLMSCCYNTKKYGYNINYFMDTCYAVLHLTYLIQNIWYTSIIEWQWFFLVCTYKIRQYKGIIEKTDAYKTELLKNFKIVRYIEHISGMKVNSE